MQGLASLFQRPGVLDGMHGEGEDSAFGADGAGDQLGIRFAVLLQAWVFKHKSNKFKCCRVSPKIPKQIPDKIPDKFISISRFLRRQKMSF